MVRSRMGMGMGLSLNKPRTTSAVTAPPGTMNFSQPTNSGLIALLEDF